jgi:hypothetical protein
MLAPHQKRVVHRSNQRPREIVFSLFFFPRDHIWSLVELTRHEENLVVIARDLQSRPSAGLERREAEPENCSLFVCHDGQTPIGKVSGRMGAIQRRGQGHIESAEHGCKRVLTLAPARALGRDITFLEGSHWRGH